MKNKTLEERVIVLEAESYRNARRFVDIDDQFGLLRGAVTELSADLREHRQDTKEQFTAVHTRLNRIDQRLDGMDQRFDGIDQRFDGIDGVLREILALVRPAAGVTVPTQVPGVAG